ncbi:MAG: hypothetical protein AAF702_28115 [Chloroflexota bacterium]
MQVKEVTKSNPNIFVFPVNMKTQVGEHYKSTILKPVEQSVIAKWVSDNSAKELKDIFGNDPVPTWGATKSGLGFYNRMRPDDHFLFSISGVIKVHCKITTKTDCGELSQDLWPDPKKERLFSLIYFLKDLQEVEYPTSELFSKFGYDPNFIFQGLIRVSDRRRDEFYEKFGTLESVLHNKSGS